MSKPVASPANRIKPRKSGPGVPNALIPQQEADEFLNIRIVLLAARLSVIFQRQALRPAGLSLQEWRVLTILGRFGTSHLRQVSRRGSLEPAHVSRVALPMEKKGLIRFLDDPTDGRKKKLALTAKGRRAIRRIWPKANELGRRLRTVVGEGNFEPLKESLDQLLDFADQELGNEEA